MRRNEQRSSAPVAVVAAALAALLLSCTPDVVLPNGAFSTIAFAPDGPRFWVATASVDGSPRELYAYDLERKEIEWRRPLAGPAAVALEPGGELVVAEQVGRDAAVSLFRADGGERWFHAEVREAELVPSRAPRLATRHVAASSRGGWLVVAPLYSPTYFYSIRHGADPVFTRPGVADVRVVRAHPETARVALYEVENETVHRVVILDSNGGEWKERTVIRDAAWPEWTPNGLLFVSSAGLELTTDSGRTLILGKDRIDTARRLDDVPYQLAPGARQGIAGFRGKLTAFDTGRAAVTRSLSVEPETRAPLVQAAGFAGDSTWLVLASGALVRLDSQGRIEAHQQLGPPVDVRKNFLVEGSSEHVNYEAELAPGGRFLSLYRPGHSRAIYRLP